MEGLGRGLGFVVDHVDQLEQNLSVNPAQPVPDPEQLGQGAPPGLQHRCEPEDGPAWTWPSGLGQGPGGSLQWGVP
eukprot:32578-Prorocentrum_lima.AAC.1